MTDKQKRAIIKIITNDCFLACQYKQGKNTCAIGALAWAASKPRDAVRKALSMADRGEFGSDRIDSPDSGMWLVRKAINTRFGTTTAQLVRIQYANDHVDDGDYDTKRESRQERRAAVIAVVNKFKTRD